MSKLTAYNSERIYWAVEQVEREAGDIDDIHLDDNLFYLKSEVDKVIADKDKEIAELKADIADLRDDKKSTDAILDERNAELAKLQAIIEERDKTIDDRKADYKEACDRLQTANLIKDEQLAATRHQKYKRCLAMAKLCNEKWLVHNFVEIPTKLRFYDKWEKRWLELAEKFKEAK